MAFADDTGRSAPSAAPPIAPSEHPLLCLVHPAARSHVRQVLSDIHMVVLHLDQPLDSLIPALKDDLPVLSPLPTFREHGQVWEFAFESPEFFLPARSGFSYLHSLLSHPGHEVKAEDLVHRTPDAYGRPQMKKRRADRPQEGLHQTCDLGALADPEALKAARDRLAGLEEQIEQAERRADKTAIEALSREKSQFVRYLAEVTGLRGKPRRAGSLADRARQSCRSAIQSALNAIDRENPALATHLRESIRTGYYCRYQPEEPVAWRL